MATKRALSDVQVVYTDDAGKKEGLNMKMIYHPGTGTVINASEARLVDVDALAVALNVDPQEALDLLESNDFDAEAKAEKIGTRIPAE